MFEKVAKSGSSSISSKSHYSFWRSPLTLSLLWLVILKFSWFKVRIFSTIWAFSEFRKKLMFDSVKNLFCIMTRSFGSLLISWSFQVCSKSVTLWAGFSMGAYREDSNKHSKNGGWSFPLIFSSRLVKRFSCVSGPVKWQYLCNIESVPCVKATSVFWVSFISFNKFGADEMLRNEDSIRHLLSVPDRNRLGASLNSCILVIRSLYWSSRAFSSLVPYRHSKMVSLTYSHPSRYSSDRAKGLQCVFSFERVSALKRGQYFKLMIWSLEKEVSMLQYFWVEGSWLKIIWLLLMESSFHRKGLIMQVLNVWQIPW